MRGGGTVLVDTGPPVALFDPSDRWHARCHAALARLGRDRLVTSLAVLTEATCLLGFARRAQRALLVFVAAAAIEIADLVRATSRRRWR